MADKNNRNESRAGIGVDSRGGAVIDPTANVLGLVEASVKRIDDIATLRDIHIKEVMSIRASYEDKLREAEAKRIDAIRAVDVNAVSVAAARASDQATVLATQLTTSAETLRTLVASSAVTVANQLTQTINPITDRIALLEKAQYEGKGKEGVTDPLFNKLIEKIDSLSQSRNEQTGSSAGINQLWGYLFVAASILIATLTFIFKK